MKKLDLSPLPEQTDDYSHYQETVVRWDRIVAFALVLVCVVGMVIYFAFVSSTDQDGSTRSELATSLDSPIASVSVSPTSDARAESEFLQQAEKETQDQDVSGMASEPKVLAKIESEEVELKETGKTVLSESQASTISEKGMVPGLNPVSDIDPSKVLKNDSEIDRTNSQEIAEDKEIISQEGSKVEMPVSNPTIEEVVELAPTIIVNSAIENAVLSLSTGQRLPGSPMAKMLSMNNQGLIKVALFTEMKGIRGKTLYHEWYRNDVRQARVKIPVNVTVQKSYSSKFIDRHMLGHWKVKVVDQDGEPYVLADFEVIR